MFANATGIEQVPLGERGSTNHNGPLVCSWLLQSGINTLMSLTNVEQEVVREVSVFSNPSKYSHMVSRSFSVGSLDVLPVGSPRYSDLAPSVGERVNGPSWSASACPAGTIIDPSHCQRDRQQVEGQRAG